MAVFLLLCIILGPRLFRSFWVDEAGTFWMAQGGPIAAIRKTWSWPGQSVLYSFIESFFVANSGPAREFLLRIPTLAGMLASFYFLYRFSESAMGKGSGLVAVILFAFHPITLQVFRQARPYSLALAAVAASCWALNRWVDTRENRCLAGYIAACTLVIYFHYFFAVIFLAHAVYLLYAFAIDRRFDRWTYILGAYAVIVILATPLWPHIKLLLHEAHTLPFVARPTIQQLTEFLLPSMIMLGALTSAFLVQFFFPDVLRRPIPLQRGVLVLLFCWWLIGPALFFLASILTPMRVFVPRYLAFSVPAQALLVAYIGYTVFGAISARIWAIVAVLLSTASPLSMIAGRGVGSEELMPFMRIIRSESVNSAPPVFYSSPLPESNFYDWQDGLSGMSRLYAPFVVYPMKNKLLPLPYKLTDSVKTHIGTLLQSQLRNQREVIFITHEPPDWNAWMVAQFKEAGFKASILQPDVYSVILFKR